MLAGWLFAGLGYVLASDFRGFSTWYTRLTIQVTHPLTRIPPWRFLPQRLKDPDAMFDRQYQLAGVVGWVFAVCGGVVFVIGMVRLIQAL